MKLHTFGKKSDPVLVLIHGFLTPWQVWKPQIDFFKDRFYIIVPALDGHEESEETTFTDFKTEADQIVKYLMDEHLTVVHAMCGFGMGGSIANACFESGKLRIKHLILDGAPLNPVRPSIITFMTKEYQNLIQSVRNRDALALDNLEKKLVPHEAMPYFLLFADTVSDTSIANMISCMGNASFTPCANPHGTRFLFISGNNEDDLVSKKSSKLWQKSYPDTEFYTFPNCNKYQAPAVFSAEEWCNTLDTYFTRNKLKNSKGKNEGGNSVELLDFSDMVIVRKTEEEKQAEEEKKNKKKRGFAFWKKK